MLAVPHGRFCSDAAFLRELGPLMTVFKPVLTSRAAWCSPAICGCVLHPRHARLACRFAAAYFLTTCLRADAEFLLLSLAHAADGNCMTCSSKRTAASKYLPMCLLMMPVFTRLQSRKKTCTAASKKKVLRRNVQVNSHRAWNDLRRRSQKKAPVKTGAEKRPGNDLIVLEFGSGCASGCTGRHLKIGQHLLALLRRVQKIAGSVECRTAWVEWGVPPQAT